MQTEKGRFIKARIIIIYTICFFCNLNVLYLVKNGKLKKNHYFFFLKNIYDSLKLSSSSVILGNVCSEHILVCV